MSIQEILSSPNRRVMAVTLSKTARAKNSKEYYVREFGGLEQALQAAKTENPKKRNFFALVTVDGINAVAIKLTESFLSEFQTATLTDPRKDSESPLDGNLERF